ncbi:MAG: DNA polymerase III subunit gamma/tau [Clostridia bacterium]|nr:DNA polymerase III subunit gamma/tau [Clostridia bacterium]
MYQALYRKWRPTVFEDVLGQSHITDTLKSQLVQNKLSHAYLFSGSRGTGKTSTAKILSRAMNCENPQNGNPCNECHACKTALNGSAVDIVEIDAASNNRVDDARIIREDVVYAPADLHYKVYIIDEAHMLTDAAFNALLKTLEEPPAHVVFIFATTEPHKFPATILSRCQRFDFKRITPYDTEKRIRQIIAGDGYTITDEAIGMLARLADGSMRDALSILDQCMSAGFTEIDCKQIAIITGASDPAFIMNFARQIIDGNLSKCFEAIKTAYEDGRDMERILEDLVSHFRNVLVVKTLHQAESGAEILSVTKEVYRNYIQQAQLISEERLLRYLDTLSEGISSKRYLSQPRLCLEVAVTAMVKRPDLGDLRGITERLQELEQKLTRLTFGQAIPVVTEPVVEEATVIKSEPDEILWEIPPAEPEISIPEPAEVVASEPAAEIVPVSEPAPTVEEFPVAESFVAEEPQQVSEPKEKSLAPLWDAVLEAASKKADFGFKRIIGSATWEEHSGVIDVMIGSDAFLNIAKMNQYDKVLKQAILDVTGMEFSVKLRSKEASGEDGDSFQKLMNQLSGFSDQITFK